MTPSDPPHEPRNRHQPGIPQRRTTELLSRPGRTIQAVPRRQRIRRKRRRRPGPQPLPPVRSQFVNINLLATGRRRVAAVLTAAPRRLPEPAPVGRPQAGAGMHRAVHEALNQSGRVTVTRIEVRLQTPEQLSQNMRRQVAARYCRPDQKPRKPDHPVKMRPARRCVPANPAVPRQQLKPRPQSPRRRASHVPNSQDSEADSPPAVPSRADAPQPSARARSPGAPHPIPTPATGPAHGPASEGTPQSFLMTPLCFRTTGGWAAYSIFSTWQPGTSR